MKVGIGQDWRYWLVLTIFGLVLCAIRCLEGDMSAARFDFIYAAVMLGLSWNCWHDG